MKAFTLSLVSLNYTLITKLTAAMLVMFFVTGGANSKESIEDTKMTYPNYQASSNSPILTDRETGIKPPRLFFTPPTLGRCSEAIELDGKR